MKLRVIELPRVLDESEAHDGSLKQLYRTPRVHELKQ